MTRAATAGELTKLRSNGQWARWKVIIDRPDVIYTARATGVMNQPDFYISFDGGSGTLTNIKKDMTVLIGSTSGGSDHGIARMRRDGQGGDTAFYVGGDSSLLVVDDDYLTILNDFAPMSKHPYETSIDVDVAYSDQFSAFVPVPIFGERIAVIDAGDTIGFDASNSWVPGSTISGYAWTFTGATSSTGTTTATPTATYNTSGRFRVTFVVTAANGKSATGYGWVYVLGVNLAPETGCIVTDLEAESEIGWACRIKAYDRPTIKDKARVVIYADDYYDNAAGSIGPVTGRENIVMVGHIIGETIIREPGQDYVEFVVGGPGLVCDAIATTPAGLTHTSFPTDSGTTLPAWAKMAGLTHRRGLHYLINYRSTLATCMDVEVEDWAWPAHKLTADDETLWGQLQTFAKHGMMQCTPNRYGHLYIQRDAAYYPIDDRTADIPVIMTMGDNDWTDELPINRRHTGEVAMVEAEGTVFNAATGVVTPSGGRAPGLVPGSSGNVFNVSEINWPDWLTSLELAGLIMGQKCAEYEHIGKVHPANNRFIDVAPRQYVNVVVDGTTLRTIPRRIRQERGDEGQITTEIELEPEGVQYGAANILYPEEGAPPVQPPPEPPISPPEPPIEPPPPEETSAADAVVVTSSDVRITANLDAGTPTWTSIISGGPTTPIDSDLPETTNDTLFVLETASVWRCTGVTTTPVWTEVWTGSDLSTGGAGVAIEFSALMRVRVAPGSGSVVYVLGCGQVNGTMRPFVLRSSNAGDTWSESWIDDEIGGPGSGAYFTITGTHGTDVNVTSTYTGGNNQIIGTYIFPGAQFQECRKDAVCQLHNLTIPPGETWTIEWDASGQWLSVNYDTDADQYPQMFFAGGHTWGPTGSYTGTHYSGTFDTDDFISGLFHFGYQFGHGGRWAQYTATTRVITFQNLELNGTPVSGQRSYPLDVSRMNNNYVYVGTENKVWKSIDGGSNWTESLNNGSNDICVDPQLSGVYYQWSDDGNLEMVVADVVNATLDTETPTATPLRLARDLNSGRLWALDSGTKLEMRNAGTWSDQDTGLTGARGLHAYLGGKLIYLDGSNIYYSSDYGATQTAKKGGWSAYASPINAHLMREA